MSMSETERERRTFQRGMDQFNREEFFESHESWEEIWLGAPEPDKTFLHGVIQIAAAFHHYNRGNRAGATSLLGKGLRKLARFPEDYRGLHVEDLRRRARAWHQALVEGRDRRSEPKPRIEWRQGKAKVQSD